MDKQTVKEDKGDCTERDRGLKWREKNRLAYGQTDSKRRQGRLQREREREDSYTAVQNADA